MVYLGEAMDPAVSARVQALADALPEALGDRLLDLVPSYASLLVLFDAYATDHMAVIRELHRLGYDLERGEPGEGRLVELPAWYSSESGAEART